LGVAFGIREFIRFYICMVSSEPTRSPAS